VSFPHPVAQLAVPRTTLGQPPTQDALGDVQPVGRLSHAQDVPEVGRDQVPNDHGVSVEPPNHAGYRRRIENRRRH
jgi:hypothetical protein